MTAGIDFAREFERSTWTSTHSKPVTSTATQTSVAAALPLSSSARSPLTILLARNLKVFWRNPNVYQVKGVALCLFGLFIGSSFYNNITNDVKSLVDLSGMLAFVLMTNVFSSIMSIPHW